MKRLRTHFRGWRGLPALLGLGLVSAQLTAGDITVFDGRGGDYTGGLGTSSPGAWTPYGGSAGAVDARTRFPYAQPNAPAIRVLEDNEVEPGNVVNQVWDMEGMFFEGSYLTIVGGFNYTSGQTSGLRTYLPGDIFIDIDGNAQDLRLAYGSDYDVVRANNYGYDFVIHFSQYTWDGSCLTWYNRPGGAIDNGDPYQILDIRDVDGANGGTADDLRLISSFYDNNFPSDPFRYLSGGAAVPNGSGNAAVTIGDPYYNTLFAGGAGSHHSLTVDLSPLAGLLGDEFGGQFTMGCGNDSLLGYYAPMNVEVPDGGSTLILVGGAVLVLGAMRKLGRRA